MARPNRNTLHDVVHYLESIGLTVYGPCMDLYTGDRTGNLMDYDADQVVKYRALKEQYPDIPYTDPLDAPTRTANRRRPRPRPGGIRDG